MCKSFGHGVTLELITARVQSTRESNDFTGVCPSTGCQVPSGEYPGL